MSCCSFCFTSSSFILAYLSYGKVVSGDLSKKKNWYICLRVFFFDCFSILNVNLILSFGCVKLLNLDFSAYLLSMCWVLAEISFWSYMVALQILCLELFNCVNLHILLLQIFPIRVVSQHALTYVIPCYFSDMTMKHLI